MSGYYDILSMAIDGILSDTDKEWLRKEIRSRERIFRIESEKDRNPPRSIKQKIKPSVAWKPISLPDEFVNPNTPTIKPAAIWKLSVLSGAQINMCPQFRKEYHLGILYEVFANSESPLYRDDVLEARASFICPPMGTDKKPKNSLNDQICRIVNAAIKNPPDGWDGSVRNFSVKVWRGIRRWRNLFEIPDRDVFSFHGSTVNPSIGYIENGYEISCSDEAEFYSTFERNSGSSLMEALG